MPYILLAIGILLGVFGLYRFFMVASNKQIKALYATIFALSMGGALFYLAITGKLAAAIGLVAVLIPLLISKSRPQKNKNEPEREDRADEDTPWWENTTPSNTQDITEAEALEILGLNSGAKNEEIQDAYKKLIKKVHPDQEGSAWMATKLNQARAKLLKK
jgi:hypothetical protein